MVHSPTTRMKSRTSNLKFQILFYLALVGVVSADLPVKPPLARYSALWKNSPFTAKPPVTGVIPESNIFDDYALIGVSSIGGNGHRVTLINKKKPDERITVDSDNPQSTFKILDVTRKPGDPLGTVVRMKSDSMEGTVSFDESLLTLVAAAPPKVAPPQPGVPGGTVPNPNIPQNPNMPPGSHLPPGTRLPRPRVVPPPNPPVAGQPRPPQPTPQPIRPLRHGH